MRAPCNVLSCGVPERRITMKTATYRKLSEIILFLDEYRDGQPHGKVYFDALFGENEYTTLGDAIAQAAAEIREDA